MSRDEVVAELDRSSTEAEKFDYKPLLLADRCDNCPNQCSQAFVRAVKVVDGEPYELLFCGHHFNRHEPYLVIGGWLIQDERNKINAKPMSGAPEGALTVNED
jgi:hypothetical protein